MEGMQEVESIVEGLQENKEDPNEKISEMSQSPMEGQQEDIQANVEESNVVVAVVPNSGAVIDASGVPFEDSITDWVRREPIFCDIDSDSESVSSSVSVSSLSSFSSVEDISDSNKRKETGAVKSTKTKGELGIEDLPPVETLTISVPEDDLMEIGTVYCTLDQLVVVESFMNSPALDFDSVLFLSHGKPLGNIFEVFGPVRQPCYIIRFNSNRDIVKSGIAKGDSVFYAPSHSDITGLIFMETLMKQKGSDASWEHNNEPPEEHLDFSDDDEERAARQKRTTAKKQKLKRASLLMETESDRMSSSFQHSPVPPTSFTHPKRCNQNSVKLVNRISGNLFCSGRQPQPGLPQHTIPTPHSNLSFGTHHEGVDQNSAVAPREIFFPPPRQFQPMLPQQSVLPPSSPICHPQVPFRPQGRIVANPLFCQSVLPQPHQTPPPPHSPVPSSSLGCHPYIEGQDRIPRKLQHTSPMPHINLRFGSHHEGGDQNSAVAPRENFFPPQLQSQLPQPCLLPPSSPVFHTDHPQFQNASIPLFSQQRLPQQMPRPPHSPVPSSSLRCHPYNEGQNKIPENLYQQPPPQRFWMPRF